MARQMIGADEFAEKWNRRIKAATPDIRAGIERVDVSPTIAAAAKKEKMRSRINESLDNGKWEAGLKRVTLEDWKRAAINKGVPRIAAGADESQSKVAQFASELLPHIARGVSDINKLPDLTIEDSINRAGTFIRHMATFKRGQRS